MKLTPNYWKYFLILLASLGYGAGEPLIDILGVAPDIQFVYPDLKPSDLRLALSQAQ